MEGSFDVSVIMSTGNSGSSVVFETFNDIFNYSKMTFTCDVKAWKSQADKDAGKDSAYLFGNGNIIKNLSYTVPQSYIDDAVTNNPGDLDAASDEAHEVTGQNHRTNLFTELASQLGINASEIHVTGIK